MPPAVGMSMNQPSSLPLFSGSSVDAGVLALLLKITFAMTKAIAMAPAESQEAPLLIRL